MTIEFWRQAALGAPRAFDDPQASGTLRAVPEDFQVTEDLGFAPDGDGSHLLLKVEKRNANTGWVAQELARAAGCPVREVGFAGLKDRRAVAVQWFSLPASTRAREAAAALAHPEFSVLEVHRHRRKLPRGALAGNAFAIRIRGYSGSDDLLASRVELIRQQGVPNYFGPQRFGRGGSNLERLATQAERGAHAPAGRPDSFVLSAARSLIFNALLGERVRVRSWATLTLGDVANLDARGSVFPIHELTADLPARLAALALHPTGPLWGTGEPLSGGAVREQEERVAQQFTPASAYCLAAGVRQERRSLRLAVRELTWERDAHGVMLSFWLRSGSFATAVLRELLRDGDAADHSLAVDADDA